MFVIVLLLWWCPYGDGFMVFCYCGTEGGLGGFVAVSG